MSTLKVLSPAKINLYLKVLNKRSDGFHNIDTLFERVSLFDTISLRELKKDEIKVECNHPQVPCGPKNLVYKVADLLKRTLNIPKGVLIRIDKKIPVAAGLGGGSSNAAAVLKGLNTLWNLGLSQKQLVCFAAQIGSDVPFFLYDSSYAIGSDRGDVIKPVKIETKLWHVLVIPRVKLYAGEIYDRLKLKLTKRNDDVSILILNLRNKNIDSLNSLLLNSLEGPVFEQCPQLIKLKEKLKLLNCKAVMVSGSGPCVFGVTESEDEARNIQKILSKRYSRVFVAQTY